MIKGIETSVRPFIKRILIENSSGMKSNKATQYSRYYDSKPQDDDYSLNLIMDFCIKKHVRNTNTFTLNSLASSIEPYTLHVKFIDNKDELKKFLISSNEEKVDYLEKHHHSEGKKISFSMDKIKDYSSMVKGTGTPEITIPVTITKRYSKGLDGQNKNPNFLACIYFFMFEGQVISSDSIGTEVVFSGGRVYNSSGYFTITNKFSFNGEEFPLTKVDLPANMTFMNQLTGAPLSPIGEVDRNQQVNHLFGAPGDIWAGPVHIHSMSNRANNSNGRGRIMAGASHSADMPHPYLKYTIAENKKIIDFRDVKSFENSLSYKSGVDMSLSLMQNVKYTQERTINLSIEDRAGKRPVFSSAKMSIRPITRQYGSQGEKTKDNIVLFFAIDKESLMEETSKAPVILNKLLNASPFAYTRLMQSLEITHFEILRTNKHTGQSITLLIGNNDGSFNDFSTVNQLGRNISKGFSLVNKTSEIYLENGKENGKINLYEFTDGEIDAHRDSQTYSYKVKLKFRDPMVDYLNNKLTSLNKIIYDLDDLLFKMSLTMTDPVTRKRVKVFDEYKKQLNSSFVQQSLNPTPNPSLPLNFSFDSQREIPRSVVALMSSNDDMSAYLSVLNDGFGSSYGLDPNKLVKFLTASLRLSSTTPTLVEKSRSLIALLRDRTEKLLNIFSVQKITKKSTNFTRKDYLKSTRSANAIVDGVMTEYEHTFKKSIDLSKTKDYFDWIEEASAEASSGMKIISNSAYKSLVENDNIKNYLTEIGMNDPNVSNLFDYSFLPYSSPAVLNLHKTDKVNLSLNHLQTVRNKVIQNTNDVPESVLIPEILATFGIKFLNPKSNLESYVTEQTNYSDGELPINNSFEDNFGSEFSSLYKADNGPATLSQGETTNQNTAWAGGNFHDYPSNTAMSLLNLTTTKAYHRKDIEFLFNKRKNITNDASLPYSVKLFSSEKMSTLNSANTIITDVVGNLFDSRGILKFEKYSYYSYLLNIFAKVYYLKGFSPKQNDSVSLFSSGNSFFIKDMKWEPLTLSVVNGIPAGRTIMCKVMLYQGGETGDLIDSDIVDMYKKYYNYNQIFLIKQAGTLVQPLTVDVGVGDSSQIPKQVSVPSYGNQSRQLLDKQVQNMKNLITEEERSETKTEPKEEIATKKSNSPAAVSNSTYIKKLRR